MPMRRKLDGCPCSHCRRISRHQIEAALRAVPPSERRALAMEALAAVEQENPEEAPRNGVEGR